MANCVSERSSSLSDTLYPDTSGGIADFKETLLFLAKQWYFYKIWNVAFVCTFVLGASQGGSMCP
jgi:hypothetical protein